MSAPFDDVTVCGFNASAPILENPMRTRLCSLAALCLLSPAAWAGEDPPCPDAQLLTCPAPYYATHQPISVTEGKPPGGDFGCRIVRPDQQDVVMCTPIAAEPHDGYSLECGDFNGQGFTCFSWPHGPDIQTGWQLEGHQSAVVRGGTERIYVVCHPGQASEVSVKAQTHLPGGWTHIESLSVPCEAPKDEPQEGSGGDEISLPPAPSGDPS